MNLFWFRRDLRWEDNAGLYHALYQAKLQGTKVLPIFVFDKTILNQSEDKADRRVDFIHQTLTRLQTDLVAKGKSLWVKYGTSTEVFEKVFSEFINEIKSGKTPNPDILCNSEIKFNAFLNHAISMGADKIATGHYAKIKEADGLYSLLKADDSTKDQSYFLYRLNQHQLSKSLFPLGNLLKKDVREIAKKEGLHNSDKKDSTGICFIGERPFTEFLNKYIENSPGPIKDEHGKILGEHIGLMFYTLGQRQGLGIGGSKTSNGEPWFVAEKSIKENTLIVAQGHAHPLLFKDGLIAKKPHWIHGALPEKHWVYGAKTRYRESDAPCEIDMIKDDSVEIFFGQKQWAITPGQSVVVYESNVCLGGAIIECAIDKAQVPLPEKIVAS